MYTKEIRAFGQQLILGCDGRCNKAFGINGRSKIEFDSEEPDDVAWFADDEVGEAPIDPKTYEGGEGKPEPDEPKLNKWCYRECERSATCEIGEELVLPDWTKRRYNQPWKHPESK